MLGIAPFTGAAVAEDPPAERRIGNGNKTSEGRREAGVQVDEISALTDVGSSTGAGSGRGNGCSYAVYYDPNLSGEGSELLAQAAYRNLRYDRGDPHANLAAEHEIVEEWARYTVGYVHDTYQLQDGPNQVFADDELRDLRVVASYGFDSSGQRRADCFGSFALVSIAEVEALARVAFSEIGSRWPTQEITLGWPEPTEDTWTALATGMPWDPISATASAGGLEVTVTATPMVSEWAIGEVNTRIGGDGQVVCSGPGDLPRVQDDASCRVWFAGPSTGLADRNGQADAVTLGLTVQWNVGYISNFAGFANPNWLVWPTESFLDGVVVNTTQSVPSLEVASG